jgi:hypothetical protein
VFDRKVWQRARYHRRIAAGLCSRCGRKPQLGQKECDKCRAAHASTYAKHCEKAKDYSRTKGRINRLRHWNKVLEHYGAQCACCSEKEPIFLTVDHIHNDGAQHRRLSGGRMKAEKLWKWLVDNEFPEGFQILCWNCNCGKHRNGGICPHQTKEVAL